MRLLTRELRSMWADGGTRYLWAVAVFSIVCCLVIGVSNAFELVTYWGQPCNGCAQTLQTVCTSTAFDIINVAFVNNIGGAFAPQVKLSTQWCANLTSTGQCLLATQKTIDDLQWCQQTQNKTMMLSIGGAASHGTYGFHNVSDAVLRAEQLWYTFLGGSHNNVVRPFGAFIFDGLDLDLEWVPANTDPVLWTTFLAQLQYRYQQPPGNSSNFFVSATPQSSFPDDALGPGVGTVLTEAYIDWVNIQYYLNSALNSEWPYNFDYQWGTAEFRNPNVLLFVGLFGSPAQDIKANGTGSTWYKDAALLAELLMPVVRNARFGGTMLWTAEEAIANNNYQDVVVETMEQVNGAVLTASIIPTGLTVWWYCLVAFICKHF